MPEILILIGLPGSGKSTYRNKIRSESKNYLELSTDDMIDEIAQQQGKTYTEVFPSVNMKYLTKRMIESFKEGLEQGRNIIIDRTNMSKKRRKEFLDMVPENYEKVAVVFVIPDNILKQRLKSRADATGKSIPDFVVTNMAKSYESPDKEEFHKIQYVRD